MPGQPIAHYKVRKSSAKAGWVWSTRLGMRTWTELSQIAHKFPRRGMFLRRIRKAVKAAQAVKSLRPRGTGPQD
jgi:hypothetical protein